MNPAAEAARDFLLDLIDCGTVRNSTSDVYRMTDAQAIRTSIANGYDPMLDGLANIEVTA